MKTADLIIFNILKLNIFVCMYVGSILHMDEVSASQPGRLIWVILLSPLAPLGEMVQQNIRSETLEI